MTDPQQQVLPAAPPAFEVGFIDLGPGDTGTDGVLRPPPGPLSLTTNPPLTARQTLTAPAVAAGTTTASGNSGAPPEQPASWTDPRYPGTLFTRS